MARIFEKILRKRATNRMNLMNMDRIHEYIKNKRYGLRRRMVKNIKKKKVLHHQESVLSMRVGSPGKLSNQGEET
jgi:hypothetical protein